MQIGDFRPSVRRGQEGLRCADPVPRVLLLFGLKDAYFHLESRIHKFEKIAHPCRCSDDRVLCDLRKGLDLYPVKIVHEEYRKVKAAKILYSRNYIGLLSPLKT